METIYSGGWLDYTCSQAAFGILALVLGIIGGALALVFWIVLRFAGTSIRDPDLRLIRWIVAGSAAVCFAIGIHVVFFEGPVYRHIAFGDDRFVFAGCDGASDVRVEIPMAEIRSMTYRGRTTGSRTTRFVQEVVMVTQANGALLIPLSRDEEVTNHAALKRILPAHVTDAYVAALDRLQWPRPAAYREP